jgi:hypothetical protein
MMEKNCVPATCLTVLLLAAASPAVSQNCSNNDFKGVYSGTVIGSFITPPPGVPAGPTARVGRVQVDGNGNSLITTTLSLNGIIAQESYDGTYVISPDCTASVVLNVKFPGPSGPVQVPFHFKGMLANEGHTMNVVLLEPQGTDLRIVLQQQRRTTCAASDLKGDYALNMAGTVIAWFMTPPGLYASVGKASFDGAGNLTASVNTSYAGLVEAETFSGTYTMDANCSFTANLATRLPSSWFGVLADTVYGANLISSTPGAVITGTLTSIN